jgi:hypothetical protein
VRVLGSNPVALAATSNPAAVPTIQAGADRAAIALGDERMIDAPAQRATDSSWLPSTTAEPARAGHDRGDALREKERARRGHGEFTRDRFREATAKIQGTLPEREGVVRLESASCAL